MTNQKGEYQLPQKSREMTQVSADTFNGKIHVEWDPDAEVTPMGQLPFFIQYLKMGHSPKPLYGHQQGAVVVTIRISQAGLRTPIIRI